MGAIEIVRAVCIYSLQIEYANELQRQFKQRKHPRAVQVQIINKSLFQFEVLVELFQQQQKSRTYFY